MLVFNSTQIESLVTEPAEPQEISRAVVWNDHSSLARVLPASLPPPVPFRHMCLLLSLASRLAQLMNEDRGCLSGFCG